MKVPQSAAVQETPTESITKLIYLYAERIDLGDFAGVGELFDHATLTFEGFGDAVSGRDAVKRSTAGPPGVSRTARPGPSTS